jgi:hypothetical protein
LDADFVVAFVDFLAGADFAGALLVFFAAGLA